jgi:hypothetical protein
MILLRINKIKSVEAGYSTIQEQIVVGIIVGKTIEFQMSKYQSPKLNASMPGGAKIVLLAIIVLVIIGVVASSSVKIVDAGNRGILTHWNAVDLTSAPLDEGMHFVFHFKMM